MNGIERIHIVSDWNDWRTKMNRVLEPTADKKHIAIFNHISMPLLEGTTVVECTKEEAIAAYDWKEGIDCIFHFTNGTKATCQEKYLTYWEDTATFEEKKSSGEPGAWYTCTAQYYFVAYAREYKTKNVLTFDTGIMLDLPGLHRLDAMGKLPPWHFDKNGKDGRRATFRYLYFDEIPGNVVIARFRKPQVQAPSTLSLYPKVS